MPKLKVKRLPRRYRSVLNSVTLSMCTSAVVSGIVTMKTVGISLETPAAWQVSCAIAVPARFLVAPLVSRLVGTLVEPGQAQQPARLVTDHGTAGIGVVASQT